MASPRKQFDGPIACFTGLGDFIEIAKIRNCSVSLLSRLCIHDQRQVKTTISQLTSDGALIPFQLERMIGSSGVIKPLPSAREINLKAVNEQINSSWRCQGDRSVCVHCLTTTHLHVKRGASKVLKPSKVTPFRLVYIWVRPRLEESGELPIAITIGKMYDRFLPQIPLAVMELHSSIV